MQHRGSSRSERAAALLRESGFKAQALDGGFPAWKAAGYPIETYPDGVSLSGR
jgi:rhodanese-related sulfurtransferase